ncbi:Ig-specific serine endopeptidase MIP [Mycoplasma phocimorsus]|uniref:Ig-specific serine endopeptidase MIP n=1 Tax=Mycoplasma phocimorsus TaxID=3045839 RepID=UPI0024BFEB84|nr:DUF31 family protein [Mycoplasma phocimorsus]MDJ1647137.1 DUF31 family protein [Mycoplasma phocimorsus]
MKKIILSYFVFSLSTAIGSIAVSCNINNKEINSNKKAILTSINNIKFKLDNNEVVTQDQIKLSEVFKNNIKYEIFDLDAFKYDVEIEELKKDFKNLTLKIVFIIKSKQDNSIKNRNSILVKGFKPEENQKLDVDLYSKLSNKEKFEYDNATYRDLALSRIRGELKNYRTDLLRDEESIEKYNKKAAQLGLDNFENSLIKNFTLPSKDGKLQMFEGHRALAASEWDSFDVSNKYLIGGLARKIINNKYKDIALQSYGISFVNRNKKTLQERVNDLDIAFKQALPKIESYKYDLKDYEKKDIIIWVNDVYAKSNILLSLAKKESDDLFLQAKKITEDYISKLKNAKNYHFLVNKSYLGFSINESSNEEIYKKEEYKIFEPNNFKINNSFGTMWILDAEISKEGYPTKFFFGTNAHVADALNKNIIDINISRANNSININQELKPNENDSSFDSFSFHLQDYNNLRDDNLQKLDAYNAFKVIFSAKDYLKSKPSDFLIEKQAKKYQDVEEFADFAVIEIDFSKIKDLNKVEISNNQDSGFSIPHRNKETINFPAELARLFTNNYADFFNKEKQIKLLANSYLKQYAKIDIPLNKEITNDKDSFFILGYPSTQFDYFLKLNNKAKQNANYIENSALKQSLWTNINSDYFNNNFKKNENGERISQQIGLRTFIEKPGIVDSFLSVPNENGKGFYIAPDGKEYISMSLEYTPRFYAPGGGASGSSLRNQKNELIGAFHYKYGRFAEIGTGLAVALRCEGYDYQGLFGDYNLPQYDLIYGTGKNQKNSYREELRRNYDNIKTLLLPNGTHENNIPSNFKFKN